MKDIGPYRLHGTFREDRVNGRSNGCVCGANLVRDEYGFICHHILNATSNTTSFTNGQNRVECSDKWKLIGACYGLAARQQNGLEKLIRHLSRIHDDNKRNDEIHPCFTQAIPHSPVDCGRMGCPFGDGGQKFVSFETQVQLDLGHIRRLGELSYGSGKSVTGKRLIRHMLKRLKLKLEHAPKSELNERLSIERRFLSLTFGKRVKSTATQSRHIITLCAEFIRAYFDKTAPPEPRELLFDKCDSIRLLCEGLIRPTVAISGMGRWVAYFSRLAAQADLSSLRKKHIDPDEAFLSLLLNLDAKELRADELHCELSKWDLTEQLSQTRFSPYLTAGLTSTTTTDENIWSESENWSNNNVKRSLVCCRFIDSYRAYDLCLRVLDKIASDATICPTVSEMQLIRDTYHRDWPRLVNFDCLDKELLLTPLTRWDCRAHELEFTFLANYSDPTDHLIQRGFKHVRCDETDQLATLSHLIVNTDHVHILARRLLILFEHMSPLSVINAVPTIDALPREIKCKLALLIISKSGASITSSIFIFIVRLLQSSLFAKYASPCSPSSSSSSSSLQMGLQSLERHRIAQMAAERLVVTDGADAEASCHIEPILWSFAAKTQNSRHLARLSLDHAALAVAFPLCCSPLSTLTFNTCHYIESNVMSIFAPHFYETRLSCPIRVVANALISDKSRLVNLPLAKVNGRMTKKELKESHCVSFLANLYTLQT